METIKERFWTLVSFLLEESLATNEMCIQGKKGIICVLGTAGLVFSILPNFIFQNKWTLNLTILLIGLWLSSSLMNKILLAYRRELKWLGMIATIFMFLLTPAVIANLTFTERAWLLWLDNLSFSFRTVINVLCVVLFFENARIDLAYLEKKLFGY